MAKRTMRELINQALADEIDEWSGAQIQAISNVAQVQLKTDDLFVKTVAVINFVKGAAALVPAADAAMKNPYFAVAWFIFDQASKKYADHIKTQQQKEQKALNQRHDLILGEFAQYLQKAERSFFTNQHHVPIRDALEAHFKKHPWPTDFDEDQEVIGFIRQLLVEGKIVNSNFSHLQAQASAIFKPLLERIRNIFSASHHVDQTGPDHQLWFAERDTYWPGLNSKIGYVVDFSKPPAGWYFIPDDLPKAQDYLLTNAWALNSSRHDQTMRSNISQRTLVRVWPRNALAVYNGPDHLYGGGRGSSPRRKTVSVMSHYGNYYQSYGVRENASLAKVKSSMSLSPTATVGSQMSPTHKRRLSTVLKADALKKAHNSVLTSMGRKSI